MQIINADPRDRRGSKQRSAMLSVLRGLGQGVSIPALIEKAQKDYDAAVAELDAVKGTTARLADGRPYYTGDDLLVTDLPASAAWASSDAEAVNVEDVIAAMAGAMNVSSREFIRGVDATGYTANERAVGWMLGRLFDKVGVDRAFGSIRDENWPKFLGAVRWWKDNGGADSIERLADIAVNRDDGGYGVAWGDNWATKHGNQVGAAIRWLKAATKAREDAIRDATTKVAIAQSALDNAKALTGYVPSDSDIPCEDGYEKDAEGKCVKKEEASVLPWVLGGAAVLGLVLFLRRR
jgi:hypothetical protein